MPRRVFRPTCNLRARGDVVRKHAAPARLPAPGAARYRQARFAAYAAARRWAFTVAQDA